MSYLCIINRVLNSVTQDIFSHMKVIGHITADLYFQRLHTNTYSKSTHYNGKQGCCKTKMKQ